MTYAAIIRDEGITFIIDGKPVQVKRTDAIFEKVKNAHAAGNHGEIKRLLDVGAGLVTFANGSIDIVEGVVKWNDEEIDNSITRRMIRMMHEGFSIEPMILFLDNLMDNPSARAVNELYLFLEQNELPISADGRFLAYKKVNLDYTDTWTGTIDNSVGQKPSMRRNKVEDNRNVTCSSGYHFCSKDYLGQYGGGGNGARVMIVKINPRDVVSIPSDYNNAKGRCCKYEVVGEWDEWYEKFQAKQDALSSTAVNTDFDETALVASIAAAKAEIKELDELIETLSGNERSAARKRRGRRIVKLIVKEMQLAAINFNKTGSDEVDLIAEIDALEVEIAVLEGAVGEGAQDRKNAKRRLARRIAKLSNATYDARYGDETDDMLGIPRHRLADDGYDDNDDADNDDHDY